MIRMKNNATTTTPSPMERNTNRNKTSASADVGVQDEIQLDSHEQFVENLQTGFELENVQHFKSSAPIEQEDDVEQTGGILNQDQEHQRNRQGPFATCTTKQGRHGAISTTSNISCYKDVDDFYRELNAKKMEYYSLSDGGTAASSSAGSGVGAHPSPTSSTSANNIAASTLFPSAGGNGSGGGQKFSHDLQGEQASAAPAPSVPGEVDQHASKSGKTNSAVASTEGGPEELVREPRSCTSETAPTSTASQQLDLDLVQQEVKKGCDTLSLKVKTVLQAVKEDLTNQIKHGDEAAAKNLQQSAQSLFSNYKEEILGILEEKIEKLDGKINSCSTARESSSNASSASNANAWGDFASGNDAGFTQGQAELQGTTSAGVGGDNWQENDFPAASVSVPLARAASTSGASQQEGHQPQSVPVLTQDQITSAVEDLEMKLTSAFVPLAAWKSEVAKFQEAQKFFGEKQEKIDASLEQAEQKFAEQFENAQNKWEQNLLQVRNDLDLGSFSKKLEDTFAQKLAAKEFDIEEKIRTEGPTILGHLLDDHCSKAVLEKTLQQTQSKLETFVMSKEQNLLREIAEVRDEMKQEVAAVVVASDQQHTTAAGADGAAASSSTSQASREELDLLQADSRRHDQELGDFQRKQDEQEQTLTRLGDETEQLLAMKLDKQNFEQYQNTVSEKMDTFVNEHFYNSDLAAKLQQFERKITADQSGVLDEKLKQYESKFQDAQSSFGLKVKDFLKSTAKEMQVSCERQDKECQLLRSDLEKQIAEGIAKLESEIVTLSHEVHPIKDEFTQERTAAVVEQQLEAKSAELEGKLTAKCTGFIDAAAEDLQQSVKRSIEEASRATGELLLSKTEQGVEMKVQAVRSEMVTSLEEKEKAILATTDEKIRAIWSGQMENNLPKIIDDRILAARAADENTQLATERQLVDAKISASSEQVTQDCEEKITKLSGTLLASVDSRIATVQDSIAVQLEQQRRKASEQAEGQVKLQVQQEVAAAVSNAVEEKMNQAEKDKEAAATASLLQVGSLVEEQTKTLLAEKLATSSGEILTKVEEEMSKKFQEYESTAGALVDDKIAFSTDMWKIDLEQKLESFGTAFAADRDATKASMVSPERLAEQLLAAKGDTVELLETKISDASSAMETKISDANFALQTEVEKKLQSLEGQIIGSVAEQNKFFVNSEAVAATVDAKLAIAISSVIPSCIDEKLLQQQAAAEAATNNNIEECVSKISGEKMQQFQQHFEQRLATAEHEFDTKLADKMFAVTNGLSEKITTTNQELAQTIMADVATKIETCQADFTTTAHTRHREDEMKQDLEDRERRIRAEFGEKLVELNTRVDDYSAKVTEQANLLEANMQQMTKDKEQDEDIKNGENENIVDSTSSSSINEEKVLDLIKTEQDQFKQQIRERLGPRLESLQEEQRKFAERIEVVQQELQQTTTATSRAAILSKEEVQELVEASSRQQGLEQRETEGKLLEKTRGELDERTQKLSDKVDQSIQLAERNLTEDLKQHVADQVASIRKSKNGRRRQRRSHLRGRGGEKAHRSCGAGSPDPGTTCCSRNQNHGGVREAGNCDAKVSGVDDFEDRGSDRGSGGQTEQRLPGATGAVEETPGGRSAGAGGENCDAEAGG
ncbi:unnamed protein product [Amoebophrya sp. A120]|nr:unnamed protein product [Amoebophrya sp. A120]|eukprot:GSA120T00004692001.1